MIITDTFKDTKKRIAAILFILLGIIYMKYYSYKESNEPKPYNSSSVTALDLNKIKQRGKFIALTDNSSTSYFVYKGEPMGYEYELLNAFSKHIGVELEIVIVKNMNTIFDQLNNGEADIIAANLTVTKERAQKVNFTEPLLLTRQVLIQRKPENWQTMTSGEIDKKLIRNTIEIIDKEVHVRKGSSFYSRLLSLSEEVGGKINIIEAPGDNDTEQLISKVASGEIDYTIADENVALLNQTYYPEIDVKTPISFPQKISWAVRKDSPDLLRELNLWLNDDKNTHQYAVLYNKYFQDPKEAGKRIESEFFSNKGSKISVYDDMIKTYSLKIDWDWRLLASMICQESRFNPSAQSWAGAYGLMQIIPATSIRYGIDSIAATPQQSIRAGTSYLLSIDKYWKDYIEDKNERIKFVLASYNVGLGHVIDARNLAIKYNKDPNTWSGNVAEFLLKKSMPKYFNDPIVKYGYCRGQEPYNYVKQILNRFEHYKNVIDTAGNQEIIASQAL